MFITETSNSPQRECVFVCACLRYEHVIVFPKDYGELWLFTSSSLCGGELLSCFKKEGYLLELFKMSFF